MRKLLMFSVPALLLAPLGGCEQTPTTPDADLFMGKAVPKTTVVEVTAISESGEHVFELSTDEVPAGWTTFRFHNTAGVTHFAFATRVDDDVTLEQYRDEVTLPFQNLYDEFFLLRAHTFPGLGNDPTATFDTQFMGGPGLTAPGSTSQTTLHLEAGKYIIECYVKTPGNVFHAARGMLAELTVTETPSGAPEPKGTLQMTIRNPENGGIQVAEQVRPGKHTVAVHFAEQTVHGNFVGNDVHLVRLNGTDLTDLAHWMDWRPPDGLVTPAPAEFLGGAHELSAGETAYFTVNLKPGAYAWIAEVDDPDAKGMLRTFTVPFGKN